MNAATREADPFAIIDQDPDPIHEKGRIRPPQERLDPDQIPEKQQGSVLTLEKNTDPTVKKNRFRILHPKKNSGSRYAFFIFFYLL